MPRAVYRTWWWAGRGGVEDVTLRVWGVQPYPSPRCEQLPVEGDTPGDTGTQTIKGYRKPQHSILLWTWPAGLKTCQQVWAASQWWRPLVGGTHLTTGQPGKKATSTVCSLWVNEWRVNDEGWMEAVNEAWMDDWPVNRRMEWRNEVWMGEQSEWVAICVIPLLCKLSTFAYPMLCV